MRPVLILHPAQAASHDYVRALLKHGWRLYVMAVVGQPAVPLKTWLALTGAPAKNEETP